MASNYTLILMLAGSLSPSFLTDAAAGEDRPLALVEQVTAAAQTGLAAFDYVYENDKIDLRPDGKLSLAYFDRCEIETFTGGVLKLKADRTKISKGGVSTKQVRPCQTSALRLSQGAREAGVAVKRVSPFPKDEWREVSIAIANPTFIWPARKNQTGTATVNVLLLEADPVKNIWQGSTDNNYVKYPDTAPPLMPGLPYKVIITYQEGEETSTVFSFDPGLELPDGILTTAVPLGL
jgi:hypothetical protein